jgi:SAM-dependent methyltransferase
MKAFTKKESESWRNYYEVTKSSPPRDTLVRAIKYLKKYNTTKNKLAYDIGSGAGYDACYIAKQKIKTIATDANPLLLDIYKEHKNKYPYLKFVHSRLEDFEFNKCHLINASFVLPFLSIRNLNKVMHRIENALVKNGIFSGQFFGVEDDWNHLSLVSNKKIDNYFKNFEIIYFDEFIGERKGASGIVKHAHIINLVVKKK